MPRPAPFAVTIELNLFFLVLGWLSLLFTAGFGLEAYNLRDSSGFWWSVICTTISLILAIIFFLAYFIPRWRKKVF
jgi:hypothetical protein